MDRLTRADDTLCDVRRVFDLRFAAPGGHELLVDLYLPAGPGPWPVILWLHGGGWRFGTRKLAPDLARHFASKGFAMVSPDYRLSGTAPYPAPLQDVLTAVRWVRQNAANYEFDSDAVGLLGSSAGGHLALLAGLGVETPSESLPVVQAVVDGYGPVDFLTMDTQREALDVGLQPSIIGLGGEPIQLDAMFPSRHPESFESLLIGAPIEERPDLARGASPITYAAPSPVPFLLMHGTADAVVPAAQSREMYDALLVHGVDTTLCCVDDLAHGFLNHTGLDDAGPRTMTVFHSGDHQSRPREEHAAVFSVVERFFRQHLCRP